MSETSRIEDYTQALIDGTTVDSEPKSRIEHYLSNLVNKKGTEGLPTPKSRIEALLHKLAETGLNGGGSDVPEGNIGVEKYFEDNYEEVILPNIKSIKTYAFYNDKVIENISMPNVTIIDGYAFYGCTNLALTELPDGLVSIGSVAFHNCTGLALTKLPDGLDRIGNNAFYGCTNLALTELPEGLTSIGNKAFYNCSNLASITFKSKPNTIASDAFSGCRNLTTINVPWAEGEVANAPWGATNATINYNYIGE